MLDKLVLELELKRRLKYFKKQIKDIILRSEDTDARIVRGRIMEIKSLLRWLKQLPNYNNCIE